MVCYKMLHFCLAFQNFKIQEILEIIGFVTPTIFLNLMLWQVTESLVCMTACNSDNSDESSADFNTLPYKRLNYQHLLQQLSPNQMHCIIYSFRNWNQCVLLYLTIIKLMNSLHFKLLASLHKCTRRVFASERSCMILVTL